MDIRFKKGKKGKNKKYIQQYILQARRLKWCSQDDDGNGTEDSLGTAYCGRTQGFMIINDTPRAA